MRLWLNYLRNPCRRFKLGGLDNYVGVCKVLQGNMSEGIRIIEQAILKRENEGYRVPADWYLLFLCEVYLQIIGGNEKLPLPSCYGICPLF
jgi:hypothetical protein